MDIRSRLYVIISPHTGSHDTFSKKACKPSNPIIVPVITQNTQRFTASSWLQGVPGCWLRCTTGEFIPRKASHADKESRVPIRKPSQEQTNTRIHPRPGTRPIRMVANTTLIHKGDWLWWRRPRVDFRQADGGTRGNHSG